MMNVLLVDDEPWVIEGLRTMVNWTNYGFQVCGEALNGPDALTMIQELRPELVLTDINMPVINGLELIERSNKTITKPPKFVILSGYDNFNYAITAMHHKVTEYLLKPIDEEEIEAVLARIGKRIQDDLAAERNQTRIQSLLVNSLLNRLIQGDDGELLEQQIVRTLHLSADAELRCMVIEASADPSYLQERIKRYFSQSPDRLFQDSTGKWGAIVPADEFSASQLEEIGIQIHRELSGELNQPVIVTISSSQRGVRSIRDLYLQALEVNGCKRCQGKEGVFSYRNSCQPVFARDDGKEKFKQLPDIVAVGGTDKIMAAVEAALASVTEEVPGLEHALVYIADLEVNLCRRIAEMNGDPDAFMKSIQAEHGTAGSFATYPSMHKYVLALCLGASGVLSDLEARNENNTIFHVIQYVDREYHGKLQLQDLAKRFHMNSTYLGQLFKKETGKPFNDYLNEKRIEEAKRLLKRSQMKISEIALQVGYPNTDYFISKFKCKTGVLPSVYKQESERKQMAD